MRAKPSLILAERGRRESVQLPPLDIPNTTCTSAAFGTVTGRRTDALSKSMLRWGS